MEDTEEKGSKRKKGKGKKGKGKSRSLGMTNVRQRGILRFAQNDNERGAAPGQVGARYIVPLRRRGKDRSGGIAQDFHTKVAGAGPVEFAEENGLPAAEHQAAVFDGQDARDAGQCGLNVRIGVALVMPVAGVARHEAVESGFDVARDGGSSFSLMVMPAVVCGT